MFAGKRILIVDDEPDLREILVDELVFEKAEVYQAESGEQAFQLLSELKFDAVLSDMRMPGGDGSKLTQKIRQKFGHLPVIILLTGFADLSSEEAFDIGADGYIGKPFHLSELKKTVRRLLEEPQLRLKEKNPEPQAKIHIPISLKEALEFEKVLLGRGGCSLVIPEGKVAVGELAEVHFVDGPWFQGSIKWIRNLLNSDAKAIGLEFTYLSPKLLEILDRLRPGWQMSLSYIPGRRS